MSSASSLTCPGFSCKYHVPKVLLRSWGFMPAFFMELCLTHLYRRRRKVFSVTLAPFSLRKRWGGGDSPAGSSSSRTPR